MENMERLKRNYIINEFKNYRFYVGRINELKKELEEISEDPSPVGAQNEYGSMSNYSKKEMLQTELLKLELRKTETRRMYEAIQDKDAKELITLMYLNGVKKQNVAEMNYTTIGAMYNKINQAIKHDILDRM